MTPNSFRCRSFMYGVTLASLTWGATMYFYAGLNSGGESPTAATTLPAVYVPLRELSGRAKLMQNLKKEIGEAKSTGVWKTKFRQLIEDGTMYTNSKSLIAHLKSKVTVNLHLNEGEKQELDETLGMVKTIEEKKHRNLGFKAHAFNALISSRLSYHRVIPDTRNDRCSSIEYPAKLPSASVIICFYNEELHALLRTVHSVLDRSNANNLREILLVDDFSNLNNLHDQLENLTKNEFYSKVKLLKTPRREGLIRSRIFGARHAIGDVLVFLDSHVEANINWLDPLLARIKESRTTVATPIIDIINAETFAYTASPIVKGGLNWGLHFRWDNVPHDLLKHGDDFVKPILSPTMAGGLFAMERYYFHELGEYDDGMDIWGGENIELSFRVWMCGKGRIEIIPCSRIGHIFRKRRPYGSPTGEDTGLKNSIRVAEVWLDEFKSEFYKAKAQGIGYPFGNITERVNLRKKLGCKSFKWYLENIYPQLLEESSIEPNSSNKIQVKPKVKIRPWNSRKRNYISKFQLNLIGTKLCVESENAVTEKNSQLTLGICQGWNKKQRWFESDKHELVLSEMLCLDASDSKLRLSKCHEMLGSQEWKLTSEEFPMTSTIYNMAAGMCLGLPDRMSKPTVGNKLSMEICAKDKPYMKFTLLGYVAL